MSSLHCTISIISRFQHPARICQPAKRKSFITRDVIILVCFLFLSIPSNTQPTYYTTYYSTENGLPANGLKGMVFDERTGFLWISTEGGLVRFDGKNFSIAQTNGLGKPITERMLYIAQNREGEIFAGGEFGKIYRINKATVQVYDSLSNLPAGVKTTFALNVSEALFRHNKIKPNIYKIGLLEGSSKVLPIDDTSCLIASDRLLFYYSARFDQPQPLPNSNGLVLHGVASFKTDGHIFFLNSASKFLRWDTATRELNETVSDFPLGTQDRFYWQNGMESPILISDTAAFIVYYRQGKLQRKLISTGIPTGKNIKIVQFNKELRTLFLATASRGLYIVREQLLANAPRSPLNTATSEAYYTQLVMPNGTILTREGHQFGKLAYTQPALIPSIPGKFYQFGDVYFKDGDSVLYYIQEFDVARNVSIRKLYRYEYATGKRTVFRTSKEISEKVAITRSGKNIYLAISGNLLRLENDTLITVPLSFSSSATLSGMTEISPGVLAIGACHYLISYTLASGRVDTLLRSPNDCIRTLYVYKDYLLIGTYGSGIYISKKGITKPIPLDKNRYLTHAHCFVPDAHGFCWISSNKGLFKVSLADLLASYEKENSLPYYHYFGKADGMINTEMNGACTPCAVWLADSTLSFPTMSGLLWVNPALAKPALLKTDIYLDQLRINDSAYHPASLENRPLPAGTNNLVIRLTIPVWQNQENNYIKYRLDNNTEWKWVENDNSITLVNPGSGQHTLEIVKIDGFGQNNETHKLIRFVIKPHWYEFWWFIILAAAAAASFIYLIVYIRTRQIQAARKRLEKRIAEQTHELKEKNQKLEKKDAIQTRLISIINHDIIAPLKFLSATGSKLIEKKQIINDELRNETLQEMTDTSRSLQLLASDILNWMKYHNEGTKLKKETFSLQHITDTVVQLLRSIAAQKNIQIISEIDPSLHAYQYYEPAKVLLYNLLMNAINFSENEPVTIHAVLQGKELVVSIADKGSGMPQEQADDLLSEKSNYQIAAGPGSGPGKGFGLGYMIIRDIVKLTGIQVSIQSKPGAGTAVMLHMESATRLS